MPGFKSLEVWKKSREVTNAIYAATRGFPPDERYGLRIQMRKAAVSIMSNIAEGSGRNRPRELIRFLRYASGSATELDCQLTVAEDQGFLSPALSAALHREVTEIQKMLAGLSRHWYRRSTND